MSNALTLDLWNSILPLVGLCALVAWLPGGLVGRGNLSQGALSRAVGVTALVALVVGAVLAAGLYAAINEGVWAGVLAALLERAGFFLGRSALFALLWGPVLGFVWLVKAQEMNRLLGLRMVDERGEGVSEVEVKNRSNVVRGYASSFSRFAKLVRTAGILIGDGRATNTTVFGFGSDKDVGISAVIGGLAALLDGVADSRDKGNVYLTAYLLKQISECDQLLWAFATNHKDAGEWLAADRRERGNSYRFKEIRGASGGVFKDKDYSLHNEFGGHPSPFAWQLLDADGQAHEILVFDAMQHCLSIARSLDTWLAASRFAEMKKFLWFRDLATQVAEDVRDHEFSVSGIPANRAFRK